jgi:hypothetical protein
VVESTKLQVLHFDDRQGKVPFCDVKACARELSAFFKEFSLGGQNREKRQNEKYEPSRFGERASMKRDFVKL